MISEPKPETDDARASDSDEAGLRREKLAVEAAKGFREALSGNSAGEPNHKLPAGRTGAASALGTPAEGSVEDGEGASPAEMPNQNPS